MDEDRIHNNLLSWFQLMTQDKILWLRASQIMDDLQRSGVQEDEAAYQAMVRVGWLQAPENNEYDEIMRAQEIFYG